MNNKNDFRFNLHKTLEFLGCDPEYADMTNPQGRRYQEGVGIAATNSYGERYVYTGEVSSPERGYDLIDLFIFQLRNGRFDISKDWRFDGEVYGSKAYIANSTETLQAERERHDDRMGVFYT